MSTYQLIGCYAVPCALGWLVYVAIRAANVRAVRKSKTLES
jgi:hypothetical protein